jgi:hypothetical protein
MRYDAPNYVRTLPLTIDKSTVEKHVGVFTTARPSK